MVSILPLNEVVNFVFFFLGSLIPIIRFRFHIEKTLFYMIDGISTRWGILEIATFLLLSSSIDNTTGII